MTEPILPPMGWYPDPADPAQERYWDGQSWTHNTRPSQQLPSPARVAPVPAPDRQSWQPTGSASPDQGPVQPGYGYQGYPQQPGYGQAYQGMVRRTADGVPVASFWYRVLGYIVDGIVLYLPTWLVGLPFAADLTDGLTRWTNDVMAAARSGSGTLPNLLDYGIVTPLIYSSLLGLLVTVVYCLLMYRFKAATVGQLVCGLRVVRTDVGQDHAQRDWSTSSIRAISRGIILEIPLVGLLDLLWAAWDGRGQTLHDKIAGTQVVRIK